jgi:glutamate-1-semialdehyde 2,1-aminomutase
MTWMNLSAGGFPLYLESARGARVTDLDGHTYVDFALGDTAAMAGHSPGPTVAAVSRRLAELGGVSAMMPTEDAEWVGAELTRRFGPSRWSFALTATDANRWAIRLARAVTRRPKVLVNSYCYHGSVDESLIVVGPDGHATSRAGNVGPPVDVTMTSRVAEFNDVTGLERELEHGDVAAVLMEPALTNMGIVLPEPGYLDAVRSLTRAHGALLINDETHTLSVGPVGEHMCQSRPACRERQGVASERPADASDVNEVEVAARADLVGELVGQAVGGHGYPAADCLAHGHDVRLQSPGAGGAAGADGEGVGLVVDQ